jgi:hypothetical protein
LCRCEPGRRQDKRQDEIHIHGTKPLAGLTFKSFVTGLAPDIEAERRFEKVSVAAAGTAKSESAQQNINELTQHVRAAILTSETTKLARAGVGL